MAARPCSKIAFLLPLQQCQNRQESTRFTGTVLAKEVDSWLQSHELSNAILSLKGIGRE
jgi:hypothetical protein